MDDLQWIGVPVREGGKGLFIEMLRIYFNSGRYSHLSFIQQEVTINTSRLEVASPKAVDDNQQEDVEDDDDDNGSVSTVDDDAQDEEPEAAVEAMPEDEEGMEMKDLEEEQPADERQQNQGIMLLS